MKASFIPGSGIKIQIKKKGMGYRYGLMALNMRDSGKLIRLQDMEGLYWRTETCTKDNGWMIKLMEMEIIFMPKVQCTGEDGSKISKKVMVERNGQMVAIMQETIYVAKNTEKARFNGLMARNLMGNGKIIKCMVTANLGGQTVGYMWAIMQMIKNTDKAYTHGLTAAFTTADFIMENNTAKVSIDKLMGRMSTASG